MSDFTPPVLLSQLTAEQKLRIIALDYIINTEGIPPLLWPSEAEHGFRDLQDGAVRDTLIKKDVTQVFYPVIVED